MTKIQFVLIFFTFLGLSHGGTLEVVSNTKDIGCFVAGECVNSPSIGVSQLATAEECLALCKETDTCLFFTHYLDTAVCVILSGCVELSNANCADCVSGDVSCGDTTEPPTQDLSIVFIAGGTNHTHFEYQFDVEVKDLKNRDSSCQAIPDVAIPSLYSTGNRYNGKAVFCGGDRAKKSCFMFNPDLPGWEEFAPLINERTNHASVQLSEDSFWLTGGAGSNTSSEYFDPASNAFVAGPTLPDGFWKHCAAKLGDIIIIGGGRETLSKFFMFDWNSQTWTPMPRIPTPRQNHACEIIDTEIGKELWVTGGLSLSGVTDSVEIFNFNFMQWETGISLPFKRYGHSTVAINNNILVLGGAPDEDFVLSAILEWNSASGTWYQWAVGLDGPRKYFGLTLVDERSGGICT